jgi:hypothetical protein
MDGLLEAERRMVKLGIVAGAIAAATYVAEKLVPLPAALSRACFMYNGFLILLAVIGLFPFLRRPRMTAAAMLGVIFGVVTGVMQMVFSVIQMANVERFGRIVKGTDAVSGQMWRDVQGSVFSVQSGMNYVFDFFADVTGYAFALAMWRHPKFGRTWAIVSAILVTPHFVMKMVAFPIPPSEAGLFDAGPLVMLVLVGMVVQTARNLRWVESWSSEEAALRERVRFTTGAEPPRA